MFKGNTVALVTPFNDDFSINEEKLIQLIEWHIRSKTSQILINGTTSEAQAMTREESEKVLEIAVKTADGRIPIIAGTSANNTDDAVYNAMKAAEIGAQALLVINPYYNKSNRSGMIAHFTKVAHSVDLPIILYNVPSRTGQSIPIDVVVELANIPNIIGIKEASGDINYLTHLAKAIPENFYLYSGCDDLILTTYALGGVGVTSVAANILPKEITRLTEALSQGNYAFGRKLQFEIIDFVDTLFSEVSPAPIKCAMNLAKMGVGPCRLPLGQVEEVTREALVYHLQNLGLKVSI